MFEIQGKYTKATIYTDNIEQEAISQIYDICNHPAFEHESVRIMPDCLAEDTEVLTEVGFVPIKDLDIYKYKVAQYDFNKSSIIFDYCLNKIVRPLRDNEKVYEQEISSLNTRILSTENHRNLFMSGVLKTKDLPKESALNNYKWSASVDSEGLKIDDDTIRFITWIVGDGNFKLNGNNFAAIRFSFTKERKIKRLKTIFRGTIVTLEINPFKSFPVSNFDDIF